MKTLLTVLLISIFSFAVSAYADELNPSTSKEHLTNDYYVYGSVGSGNASNGGGRIELENTMQFGINIPYEAGTSIKVLYDNEGHPANVGHRDGFAGLFVIPLPLSAYGINGYDLSWAIGPYFSMNTFDFQGNDQKNEKKLGFKTQFFLKHPIGNGVSMVLSLDVNSVHSSFTSERFMLGLAYNFFPSKNDNNVSVGSQGSGDAKNQVSIWFGPSRTTRSGEKMDLGFQVEFLHPFVQTSNAFSVSAISEGKSNLSERNGVAAQWWYNVRSTQGLTFSGGIGPYIAYEHNPESSGLKGLAIITMRVSNEVGKNFDIGAQFSRVVSLCDKDKDMLMFSLSKKI